jgi:hypothetical protein
MQHPFFRPRTLMVRESSGQLVPPQEGIRSPTGNLLRCRGSNGKTPGPVLKLRAGRVGPAIGG